MIGASGNSRFDSFNSGDLTIVDQTIQGNGNIGANTVSFVKPGERANRRESIRSSTKR